MRRITSFIKTGTAVATLAITLSGPAELAAGVAVADAVVTSVLTWVPVAVTTSIKLGTETDGSLDSRLDPEKQIISTHMFSVILDTGVKWVQGSMNFSTVESAVSKVIDRALGITSSASYKLSQLLLSFQKAPDGTERLAWKPTRAIFSRLNLRASANHFSRLRGGP